MNNLIYSSTLIVFIFCLLFVLLFYSLLPDTHDIVMRFNHAPTQGHEVDVGSKTTIRVVNSQVDSHAVPHFRLHLALFPLPLRWSPSPSSTSPMPPSSGMWRLPPGIRASTMAPWRIGWPARIMICLRTMRYTGDGIPSRGPSSSIRIPCGDSGRACKCLREIDPLAVILPVPGL